MWLLSKIDWYNLEEIEQFPVENTTEKHVLTIKSLDQGLRTIPLPLWFQIIWAKSGEDESNPLHCWVDIQIFVDKKTWLQNLQLSKQIPNLQLIVQQGDQSSNIALDTDEYLKLQSSIPPLTRNNKSLEMKPEFSIEKKAQVISDYIKDNSYYAFNDNNTISFDQVGNTIQYVQKLCEYYEKPSVWKWFDGKLCIICNQSALIACIMLQQQNIPARIISGMTWGPKVQGPGHARVEYRDKELNKRASLDPTPYATPPDDILDLLYKDSTKKENPLSLTWIKYSSVDNTLSYNNEIIDYEILENYDDKIKIFNCPELLNNEKVKHYKWWRIITVDSEQWKNYIVLSKTDNGDIITENITQMIDDIRFYDNMVNEIYDKDSGLIDKDLTLENLIKIENNLIKFHDIKQTYWLYDYSNGNMDESDQKMQTALYQKEYDNMIQTIDAYWIKDISWFMENDSGLLFIRALTFLGREYSKDCEMRCIDFLENDFWVWEGLVWYISTVVEKILQQNQRKIFKFRESGVVSYRIWTDKDNIELSIWKTYNQTTNHRSRNLYNQSKNTMHWSYGVENIYEKWVGSMTKGLLEELEIDLPILLDTEISNRFIEKDILTSTERDLIFGELAWVIQTNSNIDYKNLKMLDLESYNQKTLPPEIWNLKSLIVIDLSYNNLTSLPPEIWNLSALKRLDLRSNSLISLPPEIWNFSILERLDLSFNELTSLPPEIWNLKSLIVLDLSYSNLITLPPEIWNCSNLETLKLSNNPNFSYLPPEIWNLKSLKVLDLSYNNLITLPPEIWNCSNLTELDLLNNPKLKWSFTVRESCQVLGLDENSDYEHWTMTEVIKYVDGAPVKYINYSYID
jgi:hypothetical protein